MIRTWPVENPVQVLLFPKTFKPRASGESFVGSNGKRALFYLNYLLLSLCYKTNSSVLLLFLLNQAALTEIVGGAFRRASVDLSGGRSQDAQEDAPVTFNVPAPNAKLGAIQTADIGVPKPDPTAQIQVGKPSESLLRAMLVLKSWFLLNAVLQHTLNHPKQVQSLEPFVDSLREASRNANWQLWKTTWPYFRKLLAETRDGKSERPFHPVAWNAFLDLVLFMFETQSMVLEKMQYELMEFMQRYQPQISCHPLLLVKLKTIQEYTNCPPSVSRVDLLLRGLQSDLREAIMSGATM
jgi:hypothetical protein